MKPISQLINNNPQHGLTNSCRLGSLMGERAAT